MVYNVDTGRIDSLTNDAKTDESLGLSFLTFFSRKSTNSDVVSPACMAYVTYVNSLYLIVVPAAGFTQRATLDPDLSEIHVLSVSHDIPTPAMFLLSVDLLTWMS